ncbi:hypothetical protein HDU82_000526, partial [Entophlyctis luteolus]
MRGRQHLSKQLGAASAVLPHGNIHLQLSSDSVQCSSHTTDAVGPCQEFLLDTCRKDGHTTRTHRLQTELSGPAKIQSVISRPHTNHESTATRLGTPLLAAPPSQLVTEYSLPQRLQSAPVATSTAPAFGASKYPKCSSSAHAAVEPTITKKCTAVLATGTYALQDLDVHVAERGPRNDAQCRAAATNTGGSVELPQLNQ